jgi:hypothetical protein
MRANPVAKVFTDMVSCRFFDCADKASLVRHHHDSVEFDLIAVTKPSTAGI